MNEIKRLGALPIPTSASILLPLCLDWLALAIIPLSILAIAVVYIWPAPLEFPMDDAYIHFVYARNLSEQGGLFFNYPGEKGVGTSSLLWVLLLASGYRLGLYMNGLAILLGLVSLTAVGVGLYLLLRPHLQPLPALACSLFVVLSGHMLWFSLSGMETTLFLALSIWSILFYREKRWGWLGLLLGFMVLTRLEGVILALVIALVDIWQQKFIRHGLLVAGVVCACISVPWIVYLWLRTGYPLPTSGIGKHFSYFTVMQLMADKNDSLVLLRWLPNLVYPLAWLPYTIEFILGGFALPPPYILIDIGLSLSTFRLSIWAIFTLITVVIPLLWISARWLLRTLRAPGWDIDDPRLPLVIFLAWMVLHNLGYMVYLPSISNASRYGAMNHISLWIALFSGLIFVRKPVYRTWLVTGLTIIALANTLYWNQVYDANLEHTLKVRISSAQYLRYKIPSSEKCAAIDIGAIKYYSELQFIDLGNLVDPKISQWYFNDKLDRYLVENRVTCLVIPSSAGITFYRMPDYGEEMGFYDSTLFELQQMAIFKIDRERLLLGYLPTGNGQGTVTIYKIKMNSGLSEDG